MLSGKYAKDYSLRTVPGPDGRPRTEGVYVGPYFRLKTEGETLRRAKRALCLAATLCAAAVLVPLLLVAPVLRCWYVMPQLALAIVPAALLARCAVVLLRKRRFTRRERDAFPGGIAPWSASLLALSALSLAGQLVYALRVGPVPADAPVALSTLALLAAAAWAFSLRRAFAAEELPAEE